MIVTTKISELLFPMGLKKYMLLTFGTLWTALLIIALIAGLIHQVTYQKSGTQLHLERQVSELTENLNFANAEVTALELSIEEAERIVEEQQREILKGIHTIRSLRNFYSYIIRPEALYYANIPEE